jgi:serine/threonine-protein kinase
MSLIRLSCQQQHFLFDPDKKENALRIGSKFSSVYKGIAESDGRTVIIKKFNPVQKNASQMLERFKREATLDFNHPNIVNSICFINQNGQNYLLREYIEGEDILTYLKRSRLKNKDKLTFILKCVIEVLNALEVIHQHHIIHCDIRPHNILLEYSSPSKKINTQQPKLKLIDFGLAHFQQNPIAGRIPFSLIYSPPEQLLSITNAINASSDIYSLAMSMYELITETKSFHNEHPELLMHMMLTHNLKPNKTIPDFIFQLLLKATHKHQFKLPPNRYKKEELSKLLKTAQSQRFQSATEFKIALEEALKKMD